MTETHYNLINVDQILASVTHALAAVRFLDDLSDKQFLALWRRSPELRTVIEDFDYNIHGLYLRRRRLNLANRVKVYSDDR